MRADLNKFAMPEKIVGQRVVLVPRNHQYDAQIWELIDGSRAFLRPYLFWVDDTKSIADVSKISEMFLPPLQRADILNMCFWTSKAVGWSGQAARIQLTMGAEWQNWGIIVMLSLADTAMFQRLWLC